MFVLWLCTDDEDELLADMDMVIGSERGSGSETAAAASDKFLTIGCALA